MAVSSDLTSSSSVYVKILSSGIVANLIQMGMPMITSGYDQDLLLEPGKHSVNLDEDSFNTNVNVNLFIH
jgi:hypothetical protein